MMTLAIVYTIGFVLMGGWIMVKCSQDEEFNCPIDGWQPFFVMSACWPFLVAAGIVFVIARIFKGKS